MLSIGVRTVITMLEALAIGAHSLAAPGMVVCDLCNLIPVNAWPAHRNHHVVNRAAAYCCRARIKNSVPFAVPFRVRFLWVGVMFDEELPTEIGMFAGVRMECRNLCDLRRIPTACFQD